MNMVTLTIDGQDVSVEEGATILEAAGTLGIRIPTLCKVEGFPPSASCFLCAVKIEGRANLAPSCATPAEEGMIVHTNSDEVRSSRKTALELLMSDHAGDCIGPCRTGCPATLDIPGFVTGIAGGDFRRAAEIAVDYLTIPASLGRICPRLCEQRCHRCETGEPLSIRNLHRLAGERDLESESRYIPRKQQATGKRVAIVGTGPAGLSAAHHLLRRGHHATLFDSRSAPGGMLRWAIPAFRLPRNILEQETDMILALGGEFNLNTKLGVDMTLDDLRRDYDAVFLAIGAQGSRSLGCSGEEHAVSALDFLGKVAEGLRPEIGNDILILGGGNTAMDTCRTAVRLGARNVKVLYRRSRREMPCLMSEVEAAEEEGVNLETLVAPLELAKGKKGKLLLTCHRMELGPPDESGRARPVPIPDSEFTLEADTVIAAIGQSVEWESMGAGDLSLTRWGIAAQLATLATNLEGVFAGGDAVTGADLAIRAVAAGKLAAVSIDQYLNGRPVQGDPDMVTVLMGKMSEQELAEFFRNIEETPRAPMPEIPVEERVKNFREVEIGFSEDMAIREADRCMGCGCAKADTCALRQYATEYGADPLRFSGARRQFQRDLTHPEIVYEPGKCILCGACVAAAAEAGKGLGLAIVGRGFEASVAVPLKGTMVEALPDAAQKAAEVCPTGAFSLRSACHCKLIED
ncbi:MAG: FAD-dependent oxidoreductase [Acidobacteria bacterium]|nr:FAD-dependent oxidoreductase [Acidobacteriota bacterium]